MDATGSPPPGPPLPRIIQTLALEFAPLRFMEACRRRYGGVVTFHRARGRSFAAVFDPELAKEVLRRPPGDLTGGDTGALQWLGERSVVGLEAVDHLHHRRLIAPPFHGKEMRSQVVFIRNVTDSVVDSWPLGKEFALLPSMRSLTSRVIVGMVLGLEDGPGRDEAGRRLRELSHHAPPRLPRLRRSAARCRMDRLLRNEIGRRRAGPDRDDVLSMLLSSHGEDGRPLSDDEICDQLLTLLIAGAETTAVGLAWAFELLLRHPRVLARLEAELARGECDYLDAVVKETLRLRSPVAHVKREVRGRPYLLGGHLIPARTEVRVPLATLHRRADHFREPLAFRPERFLGTGADGASMWLPFGAGVHRCVGASFATLELTNVIGRVIERSVLRPARKRPERPVRTGIMHPPARGVRVVRESRPRAPAAT